MVQEMLMESNVRSVKERAKCLIVSVRAVVGVGA